MINNTKFFHCSGFQPDKSIYQAAQKFLEKVYLHAPSDSVVRVALKKGRRALEVSCQVASQAGSFVARAVHTNPSEGLKQVEKKIFSQLREWKDSRFFP